MCQDSSVMLRGYSYVLPSFDNVYNCLATLLTSHRWQFNHFPYFSILARLR